MLETGEESVGELASGDHTSCLHPGRVSPCVISKKMHGILDKSWLDGINSGALPSISIPVRCTDRRGLCVKLPAACSAAQSAGDRPNGPWKMRLEKRLQQEYRFGQEPHFTTWLQNFEEQFF